MITKTRSQQWWRGKGARAYVEYVIERRKKRKNRKTKTSLTWYLERRGRMEDHGEEQQRSPTVVFHVGCPANYWMNRTDATGFYREHTGVGNTRGCVIRRAPSWPHRCRVIGLCFFFFFYVSNAYPHAQQIKMVWTQETAATCLDSPCTVHRRFCVLHVYKILF